MTLALVFGSAGQDGAYLTKQLVDRGYAVVGVDRTCVSATASMSLPDRVDLLNAAEVSAFVQATAPDLCFYLAAVHHSSEEGHDSNHVQLFESSFRLHVDGWVHVLEAVRRHASHSRLFYAASSHVFGTPRLAVQDELTPINPNNVYGISKAAGVSVTRYYRAQGLHASNGYLYNHESPLRMRKFVSQRIAYGAVDALLAVQRGESYQLELGSLDAVVDWGYAPDYTDAMIRIVMAKEPDDYVVATGVPHTIADFCEAAFRPLGLSWRSFVVERPSRITKHLTTLVGDSSKLRSATGWRPSVTFEELVHRLVTAAQSRVTEVASLER